VRWGEGDLEGERIAVAPADPLQREHAAFLAAVRGEASFPVPGGEGLAAMQLAEAVRQALGRGPVAGQRGSERL
jgi:predicted dehydrogenase